MSRNAMFDLNMAIAITAIMAIFGHFGHCGHGHFQCKHDIDWYPLKEHSKTKSVTLQKRVRWKVKPSSSGLNEEAGELPVS